MEFIILQKQEHQPRLTFLCCFPAQFWHLARQVFQWRFQTTIDHAYCVWIEWIAASRIVITTAIIALDCTCPYIGNDSAKHERTHNNRLICDDKCGLVCHLCMCNCACSLCKLIELKLFYYLWINIITAQGSSSILPRRLDAYLLFVYYFR